MKQAKKRPLVAGPKGLVRRPEKPVSIEAMNAAIAAAIAKATDVTTKQRKKYKIEDLLAECHPDAPHPRVEGWDEMPPVGKEIISDFDDLDKLLEKVTPENTSSEIDFGPPVGKEII